MTKTRGYALIDRKTGKMVWAGLRKPWKGKDHCGCVGWEPIEHHDMVMEKDYKLTRILITPERKKK